MKQLYRMMRWTLVVLLALQGIKVQAQAPAWQEVVALPINSLPTYVLPGVNATATDARGDVYVTGSFRGAMQLGATALVSAGGADVYVAKWEMRTHAFVWATRFGGSADDIGTGIAVGSAGLYVSGNFWSATAAFGAVSLTMSSAGASFLAKLTLPAVGSPTVAWAQVLAPVISNPKVVATTGAQVYVASNFSGTATIGPVTMNEANGRAFVARLTDQGATVRYDWVQQLGKAAGCQLTALVAHNAAIYISGIFSGDTIKLGPHALANACQRYSAMAGTGPYDSFVARLDDGGTAAAVAWARQYGGIISDEIRALAVEGNAVYVAGGFNSPRLQLDGLTVLNSAGLNSLTTDALVAKLIDNGASASWAWVQQPRGIGAATEVIYAMAQQGASLYVAGFYIGTGTQFGTTVLPSTTPGNAYAGDVFVAKVEDQGASGRFAWAQTAGTAVLDNAGTVVVSGQHVCVGGVTGTGPATFGSIQLSGAATTGTGFLATLLDTTLLALPTAATPGMTTRTAGLRVLPNPATGHVIVQVPSLPSNGAAPGTLTLLDALGRPVRTATINLATTDTTYPLDLTGLAPGLYLLRLEAGGTTATQRLVVE